MDVFDCIFNRRSTRNFTKAAVDDKLIGVMLCAATNAPSAGNTQEWMFIVVKDGDVKERLADAALKQDFVAKAPTQQVFSPSPSAASIMFMVAAAVSCTPYSASPRLP